MRVISNVLGMLYELVLLLFLFIVVVITRISLNDMSKECVDAASHSNRREDKRPTRAIFDSHI